VSFKIITVFLMAADSFTLQIIL